MVKVNSVSDNSMSPYFQRDALEFSSIGSVVAQIIAQESNPVQLCIAREGNVLTLHNCDGTVNAATAVSKETLFTSALPAGSTKRHQWAQDGVAYPEADSPLSLEGFLIDIFDADIVDDGFVVVVDQSRATVTVISDIDELAGHSDEVASFLSEAAQTWE